MTDTTTALRRPRGVRTSAVSSSTRAPLIGKPLAIVSDARLGGADSRVVRAVAPGRERMYVGLRLSPERNGADRVPSRASAGGDEHAARDGTRSSPMLLRPETACQAVNGQHDGTVRPYPGRYCDAHKPRIGAAGRK